MSVSYAGSPQDVAAPATPCHPPRTTPVLPVVQFRSDEPLLTVFYSEDDANEAAQDRPKDDFYDVRGTLLAFEEDVRGHLRLQALHHPNPVEFRRRLIANSRAAGKDLQGELAVEYEATTKWLQWAPGLTQLVDGLGLAPVQYGTAHTREGVAFSTPCYPNCTPYQRLHGHNPPCCPGR